MQITDVRIRKINEEGKMKAIVSVTFDQEFVVHDIKIIEGQNGLFIAMPSRKMGEGDFRDIAHPPDLRNKSEDSGRDFRGIRCYGRTAGRGKFRFCAVLVLIPPQTCGGFFMEPLLPEF